MFDIIKPWQPADAQRSDRSAGDRARHREKIREVMKENLPEIISEESIIGKNRDRIIKVPIKGIKEYRFIYGDNTRGVGEGGGDLRPGQVVGKGKQAEGDQKAGDRPGVDYYETEVSLDELLDLMFEDLRLPFLERKKLSEIIVETKRKRSGYRKRGIRANLSLQRTARERIKRLKKTEHAAHDLEETIANFLSQGKRGEAEAAKKVLEVLYEFKSRLERMSDVDYRKYLKDHPQEKGRFPFRTEDLRFRHREIKPRKESNAVVICIMDTSGSMDIMKKYLARSFFFLLHRFVLTKYSNVEPVFIAHHTEAKEVTEEEFFHKGESGGTFISSGYNKALEIIEERYDPSLWNIYAFHCSDGDNFYSDNEAAMRAAYELCKVCNLFGYGEIKPQGSGYYGSSMVKLFSQIKKENFEIVKINQKEELWPAFEKFMSKDRAKEDQT